MSKGRVVRALMLASAIAGACTSAPRASEDSTARVTADLELPDDVVRRAAVIDPLRCTDRATIPDIPHVFEAEWSPDSSAIAVSRIATTPSRVTVTGYEEDQRVSVLNVNTGKVRELGQGSEPRWSGSGAYLAFWRDDGYLHVILGNTTAAIIDASEPDVRWVGDDLYYWYNSEIRVWSAGIARTIATVDADHTPRYPRDDAYFSADGQRFTMTRYSTDGSTERFIGVTRTGEMTPLEDSEASFTEWAPTGQTLLLRSSYGMTVRSADGSRTTATVAGLPGNIHAWTSDGRLLFGSISPLVPGANAFDRFTLWGGDPDGPVAILPNLLGARSFSPDGRYFAGVSRTGLYGMRLELYHCGTAAGPLADARAEPAPRARVSSLDDDGRRFVRPVAGAITQFLQGSHTGIDVAAPFGSILVAADDGVVDAVGWVPVGGRRVCVMHAEGLESCDYHTSLALVSVGEHVVRGQPVALVGMTGFTTGPHVHWEAKQDGRIVNPLAR